MEQYARGTVLKRNTLARLGMHYNYEFFKVSHVTTKGTVMGWPLGSNCTTEYSDHNVRTDRWHVQETESGSRKKRLAVPYAWEVVTEDEIINGVRATSCVS